MSGPTADPTELAKLLTAAKSRDVPWRVVEAETGVMKSTREGWFRRGGTEPPLRQVAYLATYLGVSPQDLVDAALKDYVPPTASPAAEATDEGSDPFDLGTAIEGSAAAASAGGHGQASPSRPRSTRRRRESPAPEPAE